MDTTAFWMLVDESRRLSDGDPEQQLEELGTLLDDLSEDELVEFQSIFDSFFYASYSWPLWGAAYVIGGGCSDDGFDYFRGWLISRGERVFQAAVSDPDELYSLIKDEDVEADCQVEGWQSVAIDAWTRKTGHDYPAFPSKPVASDGSGPTGTEWSEDELDQLYPKLSKRFSG